MELMSLVLLLIGTCSTPSSASVMKLDAGISDEFLVKQGTSADAVLISRLLNPENEKYFRGLVSRLRWQDETMPRGKKIVSSGLIEFVATNGAREGKIPADTLYAMHDAMEVIGERGDDADVKYLVDWITTAKYSDQIRCSVNSAGTAGVAERLRGGAVTGLGFSGKSSAMAALENMLKNPPAGVNNIRSFIGVVNRAISENQEISRDGDSVFFFKWKSSNPKGK
jgi:hypothetical protein